MLRVRRGEVVLENVQVALLLALVLVHDVALLSLRDNTNTLNQCPPWHLVLLLAVCSANPARQKKRGRSRRLQAMALETATCDTSGVQLDTVGLKL